MLSYSKKKIIYGRFMSQKRSTCLKFSVQQLCILVVIFFCCKNFFFFSFCVCNLNIYYIIIAYCYYLYNNYYCTNHQLNSRILINEKVAQSLCLTEMRTYTCIKNDQKELSTFYTWARKIASLKSIL